MNLISVIFVGFLTLMVAKASLAEEVRIIGSIKKTVNIPNPSSTKAKRSLRAPPNKVKHIKLLHIQLSTKAKRNLVKTLKNTLNSPQELTTQYSPEKAKIELGMNYVPVLDQGEYGTCVTFAVTTAINAALRKGDYISQLCQLMLGNYLERVSYMPSGWNGSFASTVLNQMNVFGIVSKKQQQMHGCGNLTQYPLSGSEPRSLMNIEEYYQLSKSLTSQEIFWSPILTAEQAFADPTSPNKLLKAVKTALSAGDRLTFGVILLDFDLGFAGALGSYKATKDSWVLTTEIVRDLDFALNLGGHEMIITGYDDNAIAIDNKDQKHQGLLTLRNSWGDEVGDHGNFYMSYEYFKALALEVYRIRKGNPFDKSINHINKYALT